MSSSQPLKRMAQQLVNGALGLVGLRLTRVRQNDWGVRDLRTVTQDPVEAAYIANPLPFVIEVRLEHCRGLPGSAFRCTKDAGHPFVDTLTAFGSGRSRSYADSPLRAFLEEWQPRNAAEVLGLDPATSSPALANAPALGFTMPWREFDPTHSAEWWTNAIELDYREQGADISAADGWKGWGPVTDAVGELEFRRLVSVYQSIRKTGFRRSSEPDGDIHATALLRDNEPRYLIGRGQHRVAALAAMGWRTAPVRVWPVAVRRSEVDIWPNVRRGVFTRGEALEIFDRVYEGRQPFDSRLGASRLTA